MRTGIVLGISLGTTVFATAARAGNDDGIFVGTGTFEQAPGTLLVHEVAFYVGTGVSF
jgi:acetyl-CoA carboxylase beta subunit